MEQFFCRTRIASGTGAVDVLKEYKCRRLLVATEPGLQHTETVRQIILAANPTQTAFMTDVDPDPTMMQAVEGSRVIREFQPDLVIAVGGRNVLDWGKAAVCFSKHPCTLAAMPTAAGCGSEVTDGVTLTHNGHRHLLRDGSLRPGIAIADRELAALTHPQRVRESGFELLAAAMESYAGIKQGFLGAVHAREAFASGYAALPGAFAGNAAALQRLQRASVLLGLAAEGTELGLCRAMENSLGIVFGLSRGKAAAMLLPAIIGCNAHAAGRRYAELARAAGMGGSREEIGVRNLRMGLIRLRRELELPGNLVQAGIDIRTVWNRGRQAVALTLEDPLCRNNPVAADDFLVRRILEEITGGI